MTKTSMAGMSFVMFIVFLSLAACTMDASWDNNSPSIDPDLVDLKRKDSDFVHGEIVTTTNGTPGYQVKAVFAELSEKKTTSNGWQVDGVFYE